MLALPLNKPTLNGTWATCDWVWVRHALLMMMTVKMMLRMMMTGVGVRCTHHSRGKWNHFASVLIFCFSWFQFNGIIILEFSSLSFGNILKLSKFESACVWKITHSRRKKQHYILNDVNLHNQSKVLNIINVLFDGQHSLQ